MPEPIESPTPTRWDPSANCYCGAGEIYPHRHGTGYYCRDAVERSDLPVGQPSGLPGPLIEVLDAYEARVRAQVAEDLRPLIKALTAVYDTYLATGGYEPTPEQIKAGMASLVPIEDSHAMEAACDAVLPHLVQLRRFLAEAAPAPAETFAAALPDVVGTRRPVLVFDDAQEEADEMVAQEGTSDVEY